jgi:aminomethyltransferase
MTGTDAIEVRPRPLAELHRSLHGEVASLPGGVEIIRHYGDPAGEHRSLREGVGLYERPWSETLELAGEDRARFLHGLVSCDVKALAAGQGTWGFVTEAKGHVLADATILAGDERLLLEVPAGTAPALREHLARYVITDRVEILPGSAEVVLALLGPRTTEALSTVGAAGAPGATWAHRRIEIAGVPVRLVREGRPRLGGVALHAPLAGAARLAEALLAVPGVVPVGEEAVAARRVETGIPRFGADFGREHFPQETGLEAEGVSYTKGCYLGQEVIARIHYRGQVNHRLRGLLLDGGGDSLPPLGSPLGHDGREVGRLGTAAFSFALGRPAGLAILHRHGAEPGTRLDLPAGRSAEVAELPLAE